MSRLQIGVMLGAAGMFLAIYFGCDTKPPKQASIEKSRALTAESTDISSLLSEAKSKLDAPEASAVLALEKQLEGSSEDSVKVAVLKRLAGIWFENNRSDISGYYAELIAETEGTEEAWAISGTTFTICVQRAEEQKIKDFCTGRAVKSLENAISINPANINHRVNLALCYTENPPQENPMKGVLMLRELNEKYPDDVLILKNLARLAIKTGQFDKAKERLEKALESQPEDGDVICLLAQTYTSLSETEKAEEFQRKCAEIRNPQN